jgi:hypothetical protein
MSVMVTPMAHPMYLAKETAFHSVLPRGSTPDWELEKAE